MTVPDLQVQTIRALFDRSTRLYASRPAVGYAGESMVSYAELRDRVRHCSRLLADRGVGPGDRVALLGENGPNWCVVYLGVTTLGAVVVPILTDFHASEISHILRHSESRILFVSEKASQKVEDLHLDALETRVRLEDFSILEQQAAKAPPKRAVSERAGEAHTRGGAAAERGPQPENTAALIYTSGTTGHAKGVMLSHRNIICSAAATATLQEVLPEDRFLSVLPLPHVFECTVGFLLPLMQGASIGYLRKPPSPSVLAPVFETVRPTMMLAVPLIIEKLFKTRILPGIRRHLVTRLLYRLPAARKRIHLTAGRRLERLLGGELRFFGIGGASLSPTVERFLRDAGFPYAVGYGLTETAPLLTGCGPKHTRYRSAGPPVPGVEIRIAKPHAATGIGEIQARGAPVMQGYYKDPERTAAAFTPDGWFRTGDLGRIDPGGYLYITGRLKNVIVGPSGENIYPEAVESVIHRSELVLESLVYEEDGHIVARVHLDYEKLDEQFTSERLSESQARARIARLLEEIRRATNAQVASFSRLSRIIEQMEPFEKTPTLKIKRHLYVSKKPDL
jgi:long-chain acyl-CoA synthetase